MPASGVQFVFIVGVSGSGTTLLARILSAPPGAVCLGGNYISIADEEHEALAQAQAFNDATQVLWDRHAAAVEPGRNHRWRQDLAPSEIEFLDGFFSAARRRQWPMLPGPSGRSSDAPPGGDPSSSFISSST